MENCINTNILMNGTFINPSISTSKTITGSIEGWEFNNATIVNKTYLKILNYQEYSCNSNVVILKNNSYISQTFNVDFTGTYTIIINYCKNQTDQVNPINIIFNNVNLLTISNITYNWSSQSIKINISKLTNNNITISGTSSNNSATAIQVIINPTNQVINNYTNYGCWKDNSKNHALQNNIANNVSISECISKAETLGYNTVGLQNKNECWAGNQNQNNNNYMMYGKQTNNSLCDVSNPGVLTNVVYYNNNLIQNDIIYDLSVAPIYILGNYGIAPWGSDNTFPDKTAQWIWYSPFANTNAPINNTPITFQYIYNNTSRSVIDGTLNIVVDQSCDVILNDNIIAKNISGGYGKSGANIKETFTAVATPTHTNHPSSSSSSKTSSSNSTTSKTSSTSNKWTQINFSVMPGKNMFEINVYNTKTGPAGLLISAFSQDETLLFHTDNTWKFIPMENNIISTCSLSQTGLIKTDNKHFPWGNLVLNGNKTQYLNIGSITTGMNGLTFGCWFCSNNNSNSTPIFDFGNGSNSDNIIMFIDNNNLGISVNITNIQDIQNDVAKNINNNKWYHIVWTIQPSTTGLANNSMWNVYLNGNLVFSQMKNYPINLERKKCYIGTSDSSNVNSFNGGISNFVIYQKVLSIYEINKLYNSLINLNDEKLYIYLPLSNNTVLDTIVKNYANKTYNLPVKNSKNKSENWNCYEEKQDWFPVKLSNENKVQCMSIDGKNCITQSEKSQCELLSVNPAVPENIITCEMNNLYSWCTGAETFLKKIVSPMDNLIKTTTSKLSDKITKIKNQKDIDDLMINGTFKLKVNLPLMPPYVKGESFDTTTGTGSKPNYFYLSIEKLDNNCNITSKNGVCMSMFADNKNCSSSSLTSYTKENDSFRLVLIPEYYVSNNSFNTNTDFTLINMNNYMYLKNVQTGYYISLYENKQHYSIYGNMIINNDTNINTVQQEIKNNICGEPIPQYPTNGNTYLKCNIEQDPNIYLVTSKSIAESSPVRIKINPDGTIGISLLSFNNYGMPINIYTLTSCKFNVQTYAYIEKITNTLGTLLVNVVCFQNINTNANPNTNANLNLNVEMIKMPQDYIKKNTIHKV